MLRRPGACFNYLEGIRVPEAPLRDTGCRFIVSSLFEQILNCFRKFMRWIVLYPDRSKLRTFMGWDSRKRTRIRRFDNLPLICGLHWRLTFISYHTFFLLPETSTISLIWKSHYMFPILCLSVKNYVFLSSFLNNHDRVPKTGLLAKLSLINDFIKRSFPFVWFKRIFSTLQSNHRWHR